jgi:hypothetical protein
MPFELKEEEVLTEAQRQAGYYLEEDEDFLYLKQRPGREVARWSAGGAVPKFIMDICQRDMTKRG